jgi:hypothetical protein
LVSLISISKIKYNNSLSILPWNEHWSFEWLSEIEKKDYKKDLYVSAVFHSALNYDPNFQKNNFISDDLDNLYSFRKEWNETYNRIYKHVTSLDEKAIYSKNTFKEIIELAKKDTFNYYIDLAENPKSVEKRLKENYSNSNLSSIENIYLANSKTFLKATNEENKSLSEFLDNWKWICRNYALSGEKLFEALKWLQNKENIKLKNSAFISYYWNKTKDFNWEVADSEIWTNNHAWNLLVTFWKNWKKYISQIDTTRVDYIESDNLNIINNINKIKIFDRTYDRLFNNLADNLSEKELKDILPQLEKLFFDIWNNNFVLENFNIIWLKLFNIYKILWKENKAKNILKKVFIENWYTEEDLEQIINDKLFSPYIKIMSWFKYKKELLHIKWRDLVFIENNPIWSKYNLLTVNQKINIINKYLQVDKSFSWEVVAYFLHFWFDINKKWVLELIKKERDLNKSMNPVEFTKFLNEKYIKK